MTPPRLVRRLIGWLAPADLREWLLDDLDEAFARRAAAAGARQARRWYYRQALAGSLALMASRYARWTFLGAPGSFFHGLSHDARDAWRGVRAQPVLSFVAVVSLALGIGASTAMFSVIEGVLLRPLDVPSPDRLMLVGERVPQIPGFETFRFFDNPAAFFAWRREASEFSGLAAVQGSSFTLSAAGRPELVRGARVSPNFFDVLDVRPQLGRLLVPSDDTDTNGPMVVTDRLWRSAFGADPGVIGRRVGVPGAEATIVGVLDAGFHIEGRELGPMLAGHPTDYFVALRFPHREHPVFGDFNYTVIGRLRPGVTHEAALAHLDAILANLARTAPERLSLFAELTPVREYAVSSARQELWLLLAGVLAVLLIVCVNLGGMAITRVADQRRDWAIRAALGAAPGRLARQVLGESVIVAAIGGGVGIACAAAMQRTLVAMAPAELPRLAEVHINWRVLVFGLGVSLLAGVISGMVPALRLRGADLQAFLKSTSAAATTDRSSLRSRRGLIGIQAALATVLLAAAGLLGVSLYRLVNQPSGFNPKQAVAADVVLGAYPDDGERERMLARLATVIAALPGVSHVGFTSHLPLEGEAWIDAVQVPGRVVRPGEEPQVNVRFVSSGYFDAIGIPLLAGRDVADTDRPSGPPPASAAAAPHGIIVLSRAAGQRLWPGTPVRELLGRELFMENAWRRVIGIAADVRATLAADAPAVVYTPYWDQTPRRVSLVVRGSTPLSVLASPLRAAIWRVAPVAPIPKLRALDDLEAAAAAPQRYRFTLLLAFASVALLLAAMGVYALVAHSIARRRKELALRVTFGARTPDLWRIIVKQALAPVAAGAAVGAIAAIPTGRWIASLLFEVSPSSPVVLMSAAVAVLIAAAGACVASARRGIGADPWSVLRAEA